MKNLFKIIFLSCLSLMLFSLSVDAQPLYGGNNFGLFPPTGPLNPNGKFVSLGESGGAPGPTVTGCDLYGFRAQTDTSNAINLGMQAFGAFNFPSLTFRGLPLLIAQDGPTLSTPNNGLGCGKILAAFFDTFPAPAGSMAPRPVFQIFGSGVATGGMWVVSDAQLKQNIEKVENAMSIIRKLNGVTYEYRSAERPELNLVEGRQYGFIAQEVKEVMPEAVQQTLTAEGKIADYEVMNYDMIIPVLTEALKEQQAQINELKERLDKLEGKEGKTGSLNSNLNSRIGLNQNRPNPFSGNTLIEYDIPLELNNAQLVIYDTKGSVLKIIDIDSGRGTVEFNANNLSSGVYIYAVEIDGKSMARKRMIVK
ncbi:MAG: tail fiber domain-containing protein [Bacteroidota bacterium]